MFSSVLVANRGEIAVRIVRTLRRLGVRSVVASSIPDRHSLAVRMADAAIVLDGSTAAETYLDIEAVLEAARVSGCEAIHPGYGFLSENPEFARRCAEVGIVFVGPPPSVLAGIGDKAGARQLAVANDVPVVPGWDGDDDDETLLREAPRIGFPVMIKARGGGGGRGMREVFEQSAMQDAIESARREAGAAFGNPRLLLEKLVTRAHHVEIQILADARGHVIHLGERDCSVQRRHQKLIEETPSPVVNAGLRADLCAAALRLARAVGYVNAGTFEFLVGEPAPGGRRPFYFLEVNPRLQVEHPVTELVTGLDLVELQLRIAAGEPLPFEQDDVEFLGHAIEFRINAEDPRAGFRPGAGKVRTLELEFDRVDAGYEPGDTVPAQYDSLFAKVLVHNESREASIDEAQVRLAHARVAGVPTNIGLHRAILADPTFAGVGASVDWLEQDLDALLAEPVTPSPAFVAAAIAMTVPRGFGPFDGLRWIGAGPARTWLDDGERVEAIDVWAGPHGAGFAGHDGLRHQYVVSSGLPGSLVVELPGVSARFDCQRHDEAIVVRVGRAATWCFHVTPPPPLPRQARTATEGLTAVTAPLAGTIAAVRVNAGDAVEAGQVLLLLEAMKMEHRIVAPASGAVRSVAVRERDVVREGDLLVELD